MIVILPAPTLRLPDQAKLEPTPLSGPSKLSVALGSSRAQGDQSFQSVKIHEPREDGLGRSADHCAPRYAEDVRLQGGERDDAAQCHHDQKCQKRHEIP